MKKLLLIITLFITLATYTQVNYIETVYLKNGSIINGIIIEEVPNVKIKIQTGDGNIFEYNVSEIEKITKTPVEKKSTPNPINVQSQQNYNTQTPVSTPANTQNYTPTQSPAPKEVKPDMNNYFQKSFTSITEIGASFDGLASAIFSDPPKGVAIFAINEVIGKRTSPHFSLGLGFGVEVGKPFTKDYSYYFGEEKIVIVPITFDMRAYFGKKRVAPFLNIAPGYALYHAFDDNAHTFISNIGFGILVKITPKINIFMNGGYRLTLYPDADNSTFHGGFFRFGFAI